jgi:dihydroorotate dehydrogenase
VLRGMRQRLGKSVILVGVGGIASGADAYAKVRAGASLIQLYTALVYQGPGLVARIKQELLACLARDGYANVTAAVGSGAE